MHSQYFDTRQHVDGLWRLVGSLDGSNWYYLYEDIFKFSSQEEARYWLIEEGYTSKEIGNHIIIAVMVKEIT